MNGELKSVVYNREGDALKRIQAKLMQAGASLPAPEAKGTPESSIKAGLSIALLLVEGELINLEDPTLAPGALPELPPSFGRVHNDGYWTIREPGTERFTVNDHRYHGNCAQEVYSADQLRAYAEQCRAGVWLPIESAPKDGTAVLILSDFQFTDREENIIWMGRWEGDRFASVWDLEPLWDATHWMRLPPALQSAFADDEGVKRG